MMPEMAMMGEPAPSASGDYEAGEPFSGDFEVPEFIGQLRDELNAVREALSEVNQAEMASHMGSSHGEYMEMDPIEQVRWEQTRQSLWTEESRLRDAIRAAEWLIPPMFDPPSNSSLPSQAKAKKMLREGTANGQPLTEDQRGFFGVIASGKRPKIARNR